MAVEQSLRIEFERSLSFALYTGGVDTKIGSDRLYSTGYQNCCSKA